MRTASHIPRFRPVNRTHAFTMIEVMICVVILAITSAVVMPMIGGRSDLKLAAATRRLVADLQYAQNLAIATRETVYVRFEANQYTLFRLVGGASTTIAHPVEPGEFVMTFGSDASGTMRQVAMAQPNFGSNLRVVGFNSLGSPLLLDEVTLDKPSLSVAATVTLTCEGGSNVIRIEPYTGEISVQ